MISIALDGPSGSGKSTLAKILAKELNISYLDTGAMYRTIGLCALRGGVDATDESAVKAMISRINFKVSFDGGVQRVILDGRDVSQDIRTQSVAMAASNVSKYDCVRRLMVDMQRDIAKSASIVLDGRDIGTVVLPDADFKFFITASAQVRAKRRMDELNVKGAEARFDDILREINERDYQDTHRKISPLRPADDAVIIDTSDMDIEQVSQKLFHIIRGRS